MAQAKDLRLRAVSPLQIPIESVKNRNHHHENDKHGEDNRNCIQNKSRHNHDSCDNLNDKIKQKWQDYQPKNPIAATGAGTGIIVYWVDILENKLPRL